MANPIPIALQLYSIREDCAEDLPKAMEAVAKMGYEGVEFAGFHGMAAADLNKVLDDCGLKACGTHTGWGTIQDEELDKTIEYNQAIGNQYLIVPHLAEELRDSIDAWKSTCAKFNRIAEKAAAAGMRTGYHNHTFEFQELDGQLPIEVFLQETDDSVIMQWDNGNALHGGMDINPLIEKYPNRSETVHVKEHSSTLEKPLAGEGDIDWDRYFTLCSTVGGTKWYIIEEEKWPFPAMESVEKSLINVKKLLGR
ncbi:sugar phosphate isomerase/epimerase family protein [Planctomycetota bacterium]